MADPFVTELDVRHALGSFNSHNGVGPDGHFPEAFKTLGSHIAPVLARMYSLSLQTAHAPEDWCRAIITPVAQQTQGNSG